MSRQHERSPRAPGRGRGAPCGGLWHPLSYDFLAKRRRVGEEEGSPEGARGAAERSDGRNAQRARRPQERVTRQRRDRRAGRWAPLGRVTTSLNSAWSCGSVAPGGPGDKVALRAHTDLGCSRSSVMEKRVAEPLGGPAGCLEGPCTNTPRLTARLPRSTEADCAPRARPPGWDQPSDFAALRTRLEDHTGVAREEVFRQRPRHGRSSPVT